MCPISQQEAQRRGSSEQSWTFWVWSGGSSLLLVLFAGHHVPLGHVEGRRVAVRVGRVLEQHRVIILRLHTHTAAHSLQQGSKRDLMREAHPVRRRVDQGPVEAGGLWVQGQNQLVLTEQGLWVRLWVGFPLRQRDDPASAQSVSPDRSTARDTTSVWLNQQSVWASGQNQNLTFCYSLKQHIQEETRLMLFSELSWVLLTNNSFI